MNELTNLEIDLRGIIHDLGRRITEAQLDTHPLELRKDELGLLIRSHRYLQKLGDKIGSRL